MANGSVNPAITKYPSFLHVDSEDSVSDQTELMPRVISVFFRFVTHNHILGFLKSQLIWNKNDEVFRVKSGILGQTA